MPDEVISCERQKGPPALPWALTGNAWGMPVVFSAQKSHIFVKPINPKIIWLWETGNYVRVGQKDRESGRGRLLIIMPGMKEKQWEREIRRMGDMRGRRVRGQGFSIHHHVFCILMCNMCFHAFINPCYPFSVWLSGGRESLSYVPKNVMWETIMLNMLL